MSKTIIERSLNRLKDAIIDEQKLTGKRATGKSARSLRVEATENKGYLFGSEAFIYQKTGRGPGGVPPIERIEEWIRAKRLELNPYAVAKKIAQQGTRLHRGLDTPLRIEKLISEEIIKLREDFAGEYREKIVTDIKREFQK